MDASAVLDFWFGTDPDDAVVAREKRDLWWKSNSATDGMLRQRFSTLVEQAGRRELDEWASTPRGLLALIILTDQFPRNIHRGTPRAFVFDPLARAHCRDGIGRGFDVRLRPIERVFHYLPLEHSESREDQAESVSLFSELARITDPGHKEVFDGYLRYAEQHRDIIMRFGRFPHRNRILGRTSTVEEIAFLQTPGSSF